MGVRLSELPMSRCTSRGDEDELGLRPGCLYRPRVALVRVDDYMEVYPYCRDHVPKDSTYGKREYLVVPIKQVSYVQRLIMAHGIVDRACKGHLLSGLNACADLLANRIRRNPIVVR